eukprot:768156-Hanusia_phi.AAC.14
MELERYRVAAQKRYPRRVSLARAQVLLMLFRPIQRSVRLEQSRGQPCCVEGPAEQTSGGPATRPVHVHHVHGDATPSEGGASGPSLLVDSS